MTKVLYITVSPKDEAASASKKMGRWFLDKYKEKFIDAVVEELDLPSSYIPEQHPKYLYDEVYLKDPKDYPDMCEEDKNTIGRINELSEQFLDADVYIIATPMWSLSFPAKLKMYLDCISLGGRVIGFKTKDDPPVALLDDKPRLMVYLETCGGDFPFFLEHSIHQGSNYFKHLFKGLGVKSFEHIYVEGVVQYKDDKDKYLDKAYKDIERLIAKL